MPARYDMIGKSFGRWTVLERATAPGDGSRRGRTLFRCRCSCGSERVCDGYYLRSGQTTSCGCRNSEVVTKRRRLEAGASGRNQLYLRYRLNAERSYKLPFELTMEEFATLTKSECHYCGAPPARRYFNRGCKSDAAKAHSTYVYNGLDRVDNAQGYFRANVVPCCSRCNYLKGADSYQEFLGHIEAIFRHRIGEGK